jgi:UDP-sugar transporter A1/2/3
MYTCLVIVLQGLGGLLVATVIKYVDNIAKNFATTISVVLACIASVLCMGVTLSGLFFVGMPCVMVSVYLYNTKTICGSAVQPEKVLDVQEVEEFLPDDESSDEEQEELGGVQVEVR